MLEGSLFARRYRIVRRLGAGAMGAVYEAVDIETERRRAVKIMHPHILERADLRQRFTEEAKIAGRVDNPFLVDVVDAGVDESTGIPFLVMELLHGQDMSRLLASAGHLEPRDAIEYLMQVALALEAMHRRGVIHRDLKPSNLFVEQRPHESPRIKVLDFGVAKILNESTGGQSTNSAGTPLYMAPEQFRGIRVTSGADIYALGMTAYTLLVGSPYWQDERKGEADPIAFALLAVRGPQEKPSLRAARHGITLPPRFDGWFAKMTAIEPARRFVRAPSAIAALALALDVPGFDAPPDDESPDMDALPEAQAAADATESTFTANDTATLSKDTLDAPVPKAPRSGAARPSEQVSAPNHLTTATPRFTRTSKWLLAVGALTATIAAGSSWRTPAPPLPAAPPAPLAGPEAIVACPILDASGVDEPAGWLGAAAAATVCERARLILGGDPARTLVPAELLDLPRQPTDDFPADPFGKPDARSRSLEAARRRASAYIHGRVVWDSTKSVFRVALSFHQPAGTESAASEASSRALYQAVREAMTPFVDKGLLPQTKELAPTLADYMRVSDMHDALLVQDSWLAVVQNAGALPDECKRIDARREALAEMGDYKRFICAYTLGLAPPTMALPSTEPASPGAHAMRGLLEHVVERRDQRKDKLLPLLENETTAWGRSTLAATASCLLQSTDSERALQLALRAVQADPKNPLGDFCSPWAQLLAVTVGTASETTAVHAMQAWQPMDALGWIFEPELPIAMARRAYLLSPYDVNIAGKLADRLLARGMRDEVRLMASTLAASAYPVHQLEGEHLLLRVDANEVRFRAALERAKRQLVISPRDAGWVRVQRVQMAWRAVGIAFLLGRAAELADLFVAQFVDPNPAPLDGAYIDVPLLIPAICAYASKPVATRCFTKLRALRDKLSGGMLRDSERFVEGAERYALGDVRGAAQAWRALLRDPAPFVSVLEDAMVQVYETLGESDIVERLERAASPKATEWNGASLGVVREARRAARKKDPTRARVLAKQVVDAWAIADDAVPVVEEMRRLLAKK